MAILALAGCEREISTDVLATSSKVAEVYVDGFAAGVDFQAWGKTTALSQDTETSYSGTTSLRVEVPTPDDAAGNWTGGVFFAEAGRDLSGYNALTFYVKSTASTKIEVGLGSYGDNPQYTVTAADMVADANWRKVILPIPNPAKLTAEKGLFNFSAGTNPTNGAAYTLWIDEVKYEYIPTLAHTRIESTSMSGFPTGDIEISELTAYVNLPNGADQKLSVSSKYFTFESSNPEVATVEENVIVFHGEKGKAVLTPNEAEGSITITGVYDFAPVPAHAADKVISLYCDDYENTLSSPMNGYWMGDGQTTMNQEIVLADDIHIMSYYDFNWFGIVLDKDADTTGKTHIHMDILLQDQVENASMRVSANRTATAGDTAGTADKALKPGEWVSLEIELAEGTSTIHQMTLEKSPGSADFQNFLLDNIYFY